LTIGEGWSTAAIPDDDQVMLTGPATFIITRPEQIWNPAQLENIPVPEDLVEWFRTHPQFRADEPVDLTIGGYPARQIDITALDVVDTFFFPPAEHLRIGKDDKTRITVMNVDGTQVAAITTVEPDKFEAAIAASQPIVESIRFYPAAEEAG
jgi:hypothetical protein